MLAALRSMPGEGGPDAACRLLDSGPYFLRPRSLLRADAACCTDADCPPGEACWATGHCYDAERPCFCVTDAACPVGYVCLVNQQVCGGCLPARPTCTSEADSRRAPMFVSPHWRSTSPRSGCSSTSERFLDRTDRASRSPVRPRSVGPPSLELAACAGRARREPADEVEEARTVEVMTSPGATPAPPPPLPRCAPRTSRPRRRRLGTCRRC